MSLSPCRTCTSTRVWLSATVVNTRLLRVGIVLLRSIRVVKVPSFVSMPRVCGVTSRRTRSLTSPWMIPVWMAAPMATPSSGFTARLGSLPKTFRTISVTLGARVWPPTSSTSSICSAVIAGVGEAALAGLDRPLEQLVGELLVLLPGEHGVEVLRPGRVRRDEGQHDLGLLCRAELALRLLRRLLQPLEGHAVLGEVDRGLALELADQPVDDPLVEVLAPQVRVAARRPDLEQAVRQLQDRDVEGAAAEVVDGHELAALARVLEPVGEGGRGRLVDDARDLEAGDEARVLGGLALRVVEVGGDGDDRLLDRLAEVVLRRRLQLLEHEGRDLRRRVDLVLDLDVHVAVRRLGQLERHEASGLLGLGRVELAADEPLHGVDGVLGVGEGLPLGDRAHQPLALGGEADDRGSGARPLLVRDDLGDAPLHHRHARVRRAQVDADHLSHWNLAPSCPFRRYCTSVPSSGLRSVARARHLDESRAEQAVLVGEALSVDLGHRPRLEAGGGLVQDGLLQRRVEPLPERIRPRRRRATRGGCAARGG